MDQYIKKSTLAAEIERRIKVLQNHPMENHKTICHLDSLKQSLNTLEMKDHYEQCIQYDSIKAGIQSHAETYSFNIESELFNQLTKEQQSLWRKEIEQACISGGEFGVELARDVRYKENLEAKEVDLDKEIALVEDKYYGFESLSRADIIEIAKHFFEFGLKAAQKRE